MPCVSIVIPTRNRAGYLAEALRSCCTQDFTDLEVIVVDDASEDETTAVVNACADPRIKYVRQSFQQGSVAAINRGMSLSQGDFLTWSSDDDVYLPGAIRTLVQALEADTSVAFVYAHYDMIDAGGAFLRQARVEEPAALDRDNYVGHCFLYRRNVYQVLGDYSPVYKYTEEYEFWLRVRARFKMRRIPEKLYQHRLHAKSITMTHREADIQKMVAAARQKYIPSWKQQYFLADYHFTHGQSGEALGHISKALVLNPFYRPSWRIFLLCFLRPSSKK